jgi:hypothetical protein
MWWFSFWGTWRYGWLETTMESPLRNTEEVDDILRKVFDTMSFTTTLTEESYKSLFRALEIRSQPDEGTQIVERGIFPIETICKLVDPLHLEAEREREWKIVYWMVKLRKTRSHGWDKTQVLSTYKLLHDKLNVVVEDITYRTSLYFCYGIKVYDALERILRKNEPLSNDTDSYCAKVRQRLFDLEHTSSMQNRCTPNRQ